MSDARSLADAAVETLAAIRAMDDGMTLDHPERHVIRDLKRTAESIVADALRQAQGLTFTAAGLRSLMEVAGGKGKH